MSALDFPSSLTSELVVAFAVEPDFERQVDLMMGIHPDDGRELTELEEDAGDYAAWLSRSGAVSTTDAFGRALALWRDAWPEWSPSRDGRLGIRSDTIEERWRYLLPHCSPLAAAYLFRPRCRSSEEQEASRAEYERTLEELNTRAQVSSMAKHRVVWTTSLFPSRTLRRVFEELSGLNADVKSRLGLDHHDPGFLRRYVTAHAHGAPIEELVTPRQFEELVADMYRAEGWQCHVTRYSKDNGIDIEAARDADGGEVVVLIQAKCHRSRESARGTPRPVELSDVKAFAATVRAEGKRDGVLVTSSHFTRGGLHWAKNAGRRVARLDFVNGQDMRTRLTEIARRQKIGDIASYILRTQT